MRNAEDLSKEFRRLRKMAEVEQGKLTELRRKIHEEKKAFEKPQTEKSEKTD
jgi:hypothetical protein